MSDHAFGSGELTVGVEEELLLVERGTGRLAPVARELLEALALQDRTAGHEAYAAEVELRSEPCADAEEAASQLAGTRSAASAAGVAALMGAGVHPLGALGDAPLVAKERYRRVERDMRGLIRRTPECALHVHVGMPDHETAVRAFNGLRRWLPVLEGLAANSPWWFGRDSGMDSARAALVRSYPGRGVPRAFDGWEDYAETMEASLAAAGAADYTYVWWDVRVHPRLGTVEVREMDAQSRVEDVAALAALVRGLAGHEGEHAAPPFPPAEAIGWSSFRAARDGLEARVWHDGRAQPLREVAREALALASSHGGGALEGVERILHEGNGAARRRAAHARGGTGEMVRELVAETQGEVSARPAWRP